MASLDTNIMIQQLVSHLMASHTKLSDWRLSLINHGVMGKTEVDTLNSQEVGLAYRVMLITQYQAMNDNDLMAEIHNKGLSYQFDLNTDFAQGAICY